VVIQGQDHVMPNGYTCWVQVVDTSGAPRGRSELPIAATLYPFAAPGVCLNLSHGLNIPNSAKSGSYDIALSWSPPGDDGGRGIDSFEVEIMIYSNATGNYTHYVSLIAPGNASQITFTHDVGNYEWHVRARGTTDTATGLQFTAGWSTYDTFQSN
jgi:hypothetical protein